MTPERMAEIREILRPDLVDAADPDELRDAAADLLNYIDRQAKEQGDPLVRRCRVCGCTDDDCSRCIERTGEPCHWIEPDLCSACVGKEVRAPT